MKYLRQFLLAVMLPSLTALASEALAKEATDLFNGHDLAGWTTVVKTGETPDPGTWSVADGVIKCTGKPTGYIRTEKSYKNYRLTVDWRWTGPEPAPGADGKPRLRNSGVLVHTAPSGAVWPKSFEAQLMQTNAGDIYAIEGTESAELLAAREKAVAAAGSDADAVKRAQGLRRVPRHKDSSEKPTGEWNTYEITCAGDTLTLRVNGVEQNQATKLSVSEGHICLQSEGAAIEFRNVRLEPLK